MASNVVEDVAFAQIPQALLSTQTNGVVLPVFFLFVVFMGLGSLLLTTELVVEVVDEEFPHAHVNNRTVRVVTSVICFFASCVYTTPAGPYIKVLVLEYLYYVVGFANIIGELLVVFQLYGLERVMIDCDLMLERTPWRVLQVLWTSVIPMVLTEYWPWKEQETSREIFSGHGTIPLIGMQLLKRTACGREESFLTSSTLNSIALRRRFCGQWPTSSLKAACALWPARSMRTTCTSCVETENVDQFKKLEPWQNKLLTPFDRNSVMLYGSESFSRKRGLATMLAKDGSRLKEVHEKPGLSASDARRINMLYRCKNKKT
ncbi:uncharacterized protein [Dermacentor andersoni]|uniref:uncharacterized protein n=1 Tax=Dermacentor andersoni TaxID=34620 RepID=UPI003B3AA2C4